jgi:hypothetical protein
MYCGGAWLATAAAVHSTYSVAARQPRTPGGAAYAAVLGHLCYIDTIKGQHGFGAMNGVCGYMCSGWSVSCQCLFDVMYV